ncbi:hypothetical protein [Burkholderia cepacia]|uniref:hypothetical protein n=1 Tax=Burkholderia cepacia TaxID=292 RepID=UPI002ABD4BF1|nr:hypothetical protein [Burkholderia cepacia]
MSADGPRSFSAHKAAERAKFISYREALTRLAEFTGEPLHVIADYLRSRKVAFDIVACLAPSSQVINGNSNLIQLLLNDTVRSCEIKNRVKVPKIPKSLATTGLTVAKESDGRPVVRMAGEKFSDSYIDPDLVGWWRGGFIYVLQQADLPCPKSLWPPECCPVEIAPRPSSALHAEWAAEDVIAAMRTARLTAREVKPVVPATGNDAETIEGVPVSDRRPSQGKQSAQEDAILKELERQGYRATALPKGAKGRPGPKSAVRQVLTSNRKLFPSEKTFNLAWDRLRQRHDICDQA